MMGASTVNFQEFISKPVEDRVWVEDYDKILDEIAETSKPTLPWTSLRELIKTKIHLNIKNDQARKMNTLDKSMSVDDYEQLIFEYLDLLDDAPFTIQRICELAQMPTKHHQKVFKYMRALEKNVNVVSCWTVFDNTIERPSEAMDTS